jgi:hypothetical protein
LTYIEKYNVKIIKYMDVIDNEFINVVNKNKHKFLIIPELNERSLLFIRAFERFFLVHHLMKNNNIINCFFMEIDNLIYDDPKKWIENMSKNELCYMYDNKNRCSSGLMYIKHYSNLIGMMKYISNFIETSNEFMSEMTCISNYYELYPNKIQLLPIYWKDDTISELAYSNYSQYNNTIFDAAAIGIYLLGVNAYHNNGEIIIGEKWSLSEIDYTKNKFEWKIDEKGRKKPYIYDGEKWLLINNLHIHSKNLKDGLSVPM